MTNEPKTSGSSNESKPKEPSAVSQSLHSGPPDPALSQSLHSGPPDPSMTPASKAAAATPSE